MVLFLPAALLWVVWQRSRGTLGVSILAVGLVVLLSAGWAASDQIFTHFYGPKAPVSATEALSVDHVEWMWTGGLTPTSAVITVRLQGPAGDVGLDITSGDPLLDVLVSVAVSTPDADEEIRAFEVSRLTPGTTYEYAVTVDGEADRSRGQGQFTTPAQETTSFTFTFGSCARLGSNAATYDAIAEADPLFHLITGDFFYGDIARNDMSLYADAYRRQLTPGAPAALLRETPIAYMWDDHDFGPNDANRTSPSREAAWEAYRTYVPHYSLGDRATSGAIYQAFTIGRARFVLADLRSERDPAALPDGPDKTMLGPAQRQWLERELLRSSRRNAVVFWVSSVPWIENSASPGDNWGAYAEERAALSRFIVDHDLDNIVMLAGDAHMTAADDGTNSNYSGRPGPGFPVLHAGPIDQRTSIKGGPYSEGVIAEPGQFGWVSVEDDGDQLVVNFEGRDAFGEPVLTFQWEAPPS
jgi:phosphodiesterase/alkaline phosphatase D-like protein